MPAHAAGRSALRVELTDAVTRDGVPGVDYVDMPTFAMLPMEFRDGTIEVDVLSQLNPAAPDYARAFAGIAYRICEDPDQFEAVYLRPLNGRRLAPPPPRHQRAVQYFSYPHWKFDRLREQFPGGDYEAGADVEPGKWIRLKLDITDITLDVAVDGVPALHVGETRAAPVTGRIGLFVDIGTEAFFSNVLVLPNQT